MPDQQQVDETLHMKTDGACCTGRLQMAAVGINKASAFILHPRCTPSVMRICIPTLSFAVQNLKRFFNYCSGRNSTFECPKQI